MRRTAALAVVVLVLAGCTRAVSGSPAVEPRHIDCDVIFPPASPNA